MHRLNLLPSMGLVMELVPGQTLEDLLASRRLKLPETLKYAVQIADAVNQVK